MDISPVDGYFACSGVGGQRVAEFSVEVPAFALYVAGGFVKYAAGRRGVYGQEVCEGVYWGFSDDFEYCVDRR